MCYPKVLIKFGKKEHLEQIIDGSIRFTPLEYYKELENLENKRGRGDYFDGVTRVNNIKNVKIVPKGSDGKYDMAKAKKLDITSLSYEIDGLEKTPILCFSTVDDTLYDSLNMKFKKSWIDRNLKDFDNIDAILIIKNPQLFLNELKNYFNQNLYYRNVFYHDAETDAFNAFLDEKDGISLHIPGMTHTGNQHRTIFQKSTFFSHQKEFRICILNTRINQPMVSKIERVLDYQLINISEIENYLME